MHPPIGRRMVCANGRAFRGYDADNKVARVRHPFPSESDGLFPKNARKGAERTPHTAESIVTASTGVRKTAKGDALSAGVFNQLRNESRQELVGPKQQCKTNGCHSGLGWGFNFGMHRHVCSAPAERWQSRTIPARRDVFFSTSIGV